MRSSCRSVDGGLLVTKPVTILGRCVVQLKRQLHASHAKRRHMRAMGSATARDGLGTRRHADVALRHPLPPNPRLSQAYRSSHSYRAPCLTGYHYTQPPTRAATQQARDDDAQAASVPPARHPKKMAGCTSIHGASSIATPGAHYGKPRPECRPSRRLDGQWDRMRVPSGLLRASTV